MKHEEEYIIRDAIREELKNPDRAASATIIGELEKSQRKYLIGMKEAFDAVTKGWGEFTNQSVNSIDKRLKDKQAAYANNTSTDGPTQ